MVSLTRAAGLTHQGLVRSRNEDAFLLLPDRDIFVVADGMGGHSRGDVASSLCVEALRASFAGEVDPGVMSRAAERHRGGEHPPTSSELEVMAAVEVANMAVFEASLRDDELRGMGTTLVTVRFCGAMAFVAYSGDSRIYRFRDEKLEQLSQDHSLLNEYLKNKLIRPEDAHAFPRKNVILKALGLKPIAEMEVFRRRVMIGDVFLLCSDGLHDMVSDNEIAEIIGAKESLETRCQDLIDAALAAGGRDNVTAVLVEYVGRS